jgi:hypothetical protein
MASGPPKKMKLTRMDVEWVAQVSLLRPGPPTQSLEVGADFDTASGVERSAHPLPRPFTQPRKKIFNRPGIQHVLFRQPGPS